MARNDLIFRGIQPSLQAAKERFKSEFALIILGAKLGFKQDKSIWLQSVM
jgi:hypothetical protein